MNDQPRRPNIIIFNPDEMRADALGHLGAQGAVTPNFDQLIEGDGVSFRRAFCQNPVCTPSRCSFMSGWYPHVRGHRSMFHMMRPDEPVLLKTLKEEGYFVWWGGKNDLVPGQGSFAPYCDVKYKSSKPLRRYKRDHPGWRSQFSEEDDYSLYLGKLDTAGEDVYYDSDWANIEGAIEFLQNRPPDQPFCIYLPLLFPHPPYRVEDPWYSAIDRARVPAPIAAPESWQGKPSMLQGIFAGQSLGDWPTERWRELKATYYGMCSRLDHQFGLLVQVLKDKGLYDETAIFIFSDHGDFCGDYGLVEKTQNTFEDCLTNVPLIIKPPAWVALEPGVRDALVELIDVPATVEDLTGITPKHWHFGRSLLPLLTDRSCSEHRDAVFAEGGRLPGEDHCKETFSNPHLSRESDLYPRQAMHRSDGTEHLKATMVRTQRYKYVCRLGELDELYDLEADPHELQNRIHDPALGSELVALKERLLRHYQETCDVVPLQLDRR